MRLLPHGVTVTAPQKESEDTHRTFLHSGNLSLLVCVLFNTVRLVFVHIAYQRYRTAGPKRRFRLGVTSPVPPEFLSVCTAAELIQYLPKACIDGGLEIDGEPIPPGTEMDVVQGRWLAQ